MKDDKEQTNGYFLDELHDFDDGYKSKKRSRITPFFGENR